MIQTLRTFKNTIHWSIALFTVSIPMAWVTPWALATLAYSILYLLSGSLDSVRTCGNVYWISRHDKRWFSVGFGTMRTITAPWKRGKGIYVALFKYSLQIGICKEDANGSLLTQLDGRLLDLTPHEIGNW